MADELFFTQGSFFTGCNYWASHAGTSMWSDWKADVVEKDIKSLSEAGMQVLRVFPLWSDFQPITIMRSYAGDAFEMRLGGEPLKDDKEGRAGVLPAAVDRFEELIRLSEKNGLKLIVSLLNGWMSGRLFVPPALEGRNILADPMAIQWQVRFVKYFVERFSGEKVIIAWEPGNECNCLSRLSSREEAWNWTASIVNAIKSNDRTRPVLSGMHGLTTDGKWIIQDQSELTDVLTVHPYPLFTPYCNLDPVNTIRPILHAAAQSCYYSGIGRRPCFTEEFGTLGPMLAGEKVTGEFVRASLFSQWAHGGLGGLWWCAFDQDRLTHAPYDWFANERELGLIRSDGSNKPVLEEMGKFAACMKKLPFERLPQRITDGVCILTSDQDQWGVAFGAFMLSKQAGADIDFQYASQPLKLSQVYLMPCISGSRVIDRNKWVELLERVSEGAVLYISYLDGALSGFKDVTGLEIQTRRKCSSSESVKFDGINGNPILTLERNCVLELEPLQAKVIGSNEKGEIAFSCMEYGRGKVYFLAYPMEMQLVGRSGVFCEEGSQPYWQIYREIFADTAEARMIHKDDPQIGITEHPVDSDTRIAVMVNYSTVKNAVTFSIKKGWTIGNNLYGNCPDLKKDHYVIEISTNDAAVFTIKKGV